MESGRLASVISEREIDLAQDTVSATAPAQTVTVGEIARHGVYVVELTEPLDVVLLHMAKEHLDCALVVKDGKLAGIFTTTDASRAFGQLLRDLFPRGGGDAAA
jgi:CBS domain-containing protein